MVVPVSRPTSSPASAGENPASRHSWANQPKIA